MHVELNYGTTAIEKRTGVNRSLVRKWLIQQGVYTTGGRSKAPISPKGILRQVSAQAEAFTAETKIIKRQEKLWLKHPAVAAFKYRKRYNSDPGFMIQERIKRRISKLIKFPSPRSSATVRKFCGIDMNELKKWIESQFQKGMTWKNYGAWHIDHKQPCASFDLTTEPGAMDCFHYSNLQPLWAADNLSKSDTMPAHQKCSMLRTL